MKSVCVFVLSICCLFSNSQSSTEPVPKSFSVLKAGETDLSSPDLASERKQVVEMPVQRPSKKEEPKKIQRSFERKAVIDLSEATPDYNATLIKEMPKQGGSKMVNYNYPQRSSATNQQSSAPTLPTPIKGMSLQGNAFSVSTPCDNDMAISDSGFVVSVMNTNIYFRNTITGITFPSKALSSFTHPINTFHQEFDPKVIYDPDMDRFVLVCLVGNVDTTSKVILGFSKTNKANGLWNLYTLPGDALNNGLWSDYPMLSLSKGELFLTINLLYNDSTWQAGFVETIVWQINKHNGYQGQTLNTALHSNIKYNGKPLRNLCPVKGGSKLNTPNMYFLSNRNLASQNDSLFLVNLTDTISSSTSSITVKALVANQPYYFPNNGRQTIASQFLATNDSRNLGAFLENNIIQYVHNSNNPVNNQPTIYYGVIDSVTATTPTVKGYLLPNDTMDFAYPNISYAGVSNTDNTSIITFDHSSPKVHPGVSAIQADGAGNFSNFLRIQNGLNYVNLLQDSLERWGDYSGSQRRYNNPGEVWMSGYYGYLYNSGFPKAHAAWIAQLTTSTTSIPTHVEETRELTNASVFPNPASNRFDVSFSISKPEYLSFELYDSQGKLVVLLLRDWVKTPQNIFSFDTKDLVKGIYILKITGNNQTQVNKKIVIQ